MEIEVNPHRHGAGGSEVNVYLSSQGPKGAGRGAGGPWEGVGHGMGRGHFDRGSLKYLGTWWVVFAGESVEKTSYHVDVAQLWMRRYRCQISGWIPVRKSI